MEVKGINFGSSLLVPSVQELASQPMTTVPQRYVRPDQDPTIVSGATSVSEIPVIDMQSLLAGETMESELEKLHSACKNWGFFQISISVEAAIIVGLAFCKTMEVKGINFGSSLLVPSVQELACQPITSVPPRYVRPEQDTTTISGATSVSEIPIINMQSFLAGETMESELEKLHSACKNWGFFQLINHGVDNSLLDKIKWEIQEFFKLPIEEKQKLWQIPGDIEGFGQAFVVSEEQKLDWCDMFYMVTLPPHLRKPHLLPNLPPSFREALEVYSLELKDLAMNILAQMAKALKIESEEIKELFEDGIQSMRMNYYPPCPQPESVIGLTPHSDACALTILLQVNEMEGLQIKKDGNWVPVKPLPNACIVNIADMLEIETNGIYRSVEHRATVNSTEKERLSIATFYMPRVDKQIGPLKSLISPETPPLFKTINVGEYFKGFLARKLYSKSYLDDMKL